MSYPQKIFRCFVALVAVNLLSHANADVPVDKTLESRLNNSFVTLRGQAVETSAQGFLLDYGEGTVFVEMDDWDRFLEGRLVLEGAEVTVYGLIDEDFYHQRRIKAASLYIDDLDKVFSNISPTTEESMGVYFYTGPVGHDLVLTGIVRSAQEREFTIDTGNREINVDTTMMLFDPLDEFGFQKIDVGDVVRVYGDLNSNLFEANEIIAQAIVSLDS